MLGKKSLLLWKLHFILFLLVSELVWRTTHIAGNTLHFICGAMLCERTSTEKKTE